MIDSTRKLRIVIRHYPEDGHFNVSDIDVGPLIGGLTEEPIRLARGVPEDGSIKIEIERTHEWEIILGLAITGGGIFAKAVLETLGKRLVNWIADQVEKRLKDEHVEVRGEDGEAVRIDPGNPAARRTPFIRLIEQTAERGGTIVILFPW
jgi:hypothetical protein